MDCRFYPSNESLHRDAHELVITTHGFLASGRCLQRLGRSLNSAGFETVAWTYPSLRGSILSHASSLANLIGQSLTRRDIRRIHFVTHSMGGIIARVAIAQSRMETLAKNRCGQLLMMAPPNGGSWLTRMPMGPFAGMFPQLRELSERADSLVNRLPLPTRMPVGIIAAKHDWVVSQRSTRLPCQSDHAVVATTHQRLVRNPEAIEMTLRFLCEGRLQPNPDEVDLPATVPFSRANGVSSGTAVASLPLRRAA